jgi:hypothetical protein
MPQEDDVYVISDENILDSLMKSPARKARSESATAVADVPIQLAVQPAARPAASRDAAANPDDRRLPRAAVASTLSLLVCGGGQIYNGQMKLGALFLLTEALAVAAHWSAARMWPMLRDLADLFSFSERAMFLAGAVADALLVVFYLVNVGQAYLRAAGARDREPVFRTPVLPGLASLLVPGWGQILNAQISKAIFFLFLLLAEIYAVAMIGFTPLQRLAQETSLGLFLAEEPAMIGAGIVFMAVLTWTLSVYDAVLVSSFRRRMAAR